MFYFFRAFLLTSLLAFTGLTANQTYKKTFMDMPLEEYIAGDYPRCLLLIDLIQKEKVEVRKEILKCQLKVEVLVILDKTDYIIKWIEEDIERSLNSNASYNPQGGFDTISKYEKAKKLVQQLLVHTQ